MKAARFILAFVLVGGFTSGAIGKTPHITAETLIEETRQDPAYAPYPRFLEHIAKLIRVKETETRLLNVNPYAAELLGGNGQPSIQVHSEDVRTFFQAAADDEMTIIRAMTLVARLAHRTNLLIYLNGRHAIEAVERSGLDLGLAVPVKRLELFAYVPFKDEDNDGTLCRFIALYGEPFDHRFRKEVLNATLKVGSGRAAPFLSPWDENAEIDTVYVVEGNIVSNEAGFGYTDVAGIGGRKHGALGLLQKVFFFLPDAIDDMVVRDGDLHVNALINQRVENFESSLRYAVHHRDGVFLNPGSR